MYLNRPYPQLNSKLQTTHGRSSPNTHTSPDNDPYLLDKSDWMELSQPSREKINAMKRRIKEINRSPNGSIHLQTSDTTPLEQETITTADNISNLDPFQDTMRQFLLRASGQQNVMRTHSSYHILSQVITPKYGRLVSDSGADTSALSDTFAHILATHDMEITIDGCHPHHSEVYKLCDGVVAIDIGTETYLLGLYSVPLIPNSVGLLLSELQVRANGIHIDSNPKCFGGEGVITVSDKLKIPLHLERGLMTCPIRKPTSDELANLSIAWLNDHRPWDPSQYDEAFTSHMLTPRGYTDGQVHMTKSSPKSLDPEEISRFFLYRPKDIIVSALAATTRLATTIEDTQMRRHFKSRFPMLNRPRLQEVYATDTWWSYLCPTVLWTYVSIPCFISNEERVRWATCSRRFYPESWCPDNLEE